jgi:hypothetical protein
MAAVGMISTSAPGISSAVLVVDRTGSGSNSPCTNKVGTRRPVKPRASVLRSKCRAIERFVSIDA